MEGHELRSAIGSSGMEGVLAQRRSLTREVYDVVIDMLINHRLSPGARLNIDELARLLGVSPTPVREALARVESEGLILKEPRRGYTVAPLIQLEELRELIGLRLMIEPPMAAMAAERASAKQAAALRAFARTGGAGKNDSAAIRLDMTYDAQFHDFIAAMAGSRLVRETLGRLHSHMHMYRLYHHAGQAAATKPEHLTIARAIAGRDPDGAADAMTTHLQTALGRLEGVFGT